MPAFLTTICQSVRSPTIAGEGDRRVFWIVSRGCLPSISTGSQSATVCGAAPANSNCDEAQLSRFGQGASAWKRTSMVLAAPSASGPMLCHTSLPGSTTSGGGDAARKVRHIVGYTSIRGTVARSTPVTLVMVTW
ncbi:MAG: hypothetical protein BWY10_02406 [Chloroflexi bacterium ADurb.Bin180]|nr:MAG: hypothetical protein BWY10_02406 [Chloroflexi bacterium ADurb.Bin180]